MEAIISFVMTQASIWAPSLVAVLGVIVAVASAIHKVKMALGDIQETNKEIKNSKEFKVLHDDLRQAHLDNKELKEMNALLLDKVTNVSGYYDKFKEEKNNERENKKTKE